MPRNTADDGPVPVVFDTDMATDCDDAGALAMLHSLARRGEADLLATVVNNKGARSTGVVAAINAFYDRQNVPLGAYKGDAVGREVAPFFADIAADTETYGHEHIDRSTVPGAVSVYRRVLAEADEGVTIVSVGHLNNLHALLDSGPGPYAQEDGESLVERAVERLVIMGGEYPAGEEHNFCARGSERFTAPVLERWPTSILFSGYELGAEIRTGPALAPLDEHHPVRRAYAGHYSNPLIDGRQSWDQTAVLAGVRDPMDYFKMSDPGRIIVAPDGSNNWEADPEGDHRYLRVRADPSPAEVAETISDLMVETP